MARLLAIDYGRKRCGIAVTDELQIVATGVATVPTHTLTDYIKKYIASENVQTIVVGYPRTMQGEDSESMRYIKPGIANLRKNLPENIDIVFWDERFTSALAHRAMIDGGMKKMRRRDKSVVDEMAATIILNDYLESKSYKQ